LSSILFSTAAHKGKTSYFKCAKQFVYLGFDLHIQPNPATFNHHEKVRVNPQAPTLR